ncbi:MAG: DUF3683 domain-containing protein [Uliginosibacterium sp.]|nr:DUF3683 domain-containing protein [Uliginosibacterium sp.]
MLYEVLGDIWVVQRNPGKITCWPTEASAGFARRLAPPSAGSESAAASRRPKTASAP